jgi:membrane protein DedA with SNARE-associated domain
MISRVLEAVSGLIILVIGELGYAGVVLLMAIESACIPLPSEVILPFAGYLVYAGRFRLLWVALWGAVGCNVGSAVAYAVGYYGGRPLAEKYGRWVLLSRHDLDIADRWFKDYGNSTVFFSRLLPVVRTFIALPAGIARMPFLRFNVYTFLGSLPWCWLLAYAGLRLGEHWKSIREYLHRFDLIVGLVILAALAYFVWSHFPRRRTALT